MPSIEDESSNSRVTTHFRIGGCETSAFAPASRAAVLYHGFAQQQELDQQNNSDTNIEDNEDEKYFLQQQHKGRSHLFLLKNQYRNTSEGTLAKFPTQQIDADGKGNLTGKALMYDRTSKVAKTRYSDHGSHGIVHSIEESGSPIYPSILKSLTCSLNQFYTACKLAMHSSVSDGASFDTYEEKNAPSPGGRGSKKRVSPTVHGSNCSMSLSNLAQRRGQGAQIQSQNQPLPSKISASISELPSNITEETLGTPLKYSQNASIDASESLVNALNAVAASQMQIMKSNAAKISQAPTGDGPASLLHVALMGTNATATEDTATMPPPAVQQPYQIQNYPTTRGECLTNPSTPDVNNSLDNVEGNLIVHKNDLMRVANQNIHQHQSKRTSGSGSDKKFVTGDRFGTSDFLVLGMLGQGTFAQVFKCRNLSTGQMVALKIVKNKPAYTRQAAVEIDVFQTLSKDTPSVVDHSHHGDGVVIGDDDDGISKDNIVTLLCYFMHHSHLCLAFELLGLNLYEVLKRRQFRGLPIGVVRELAKQAIEGIKDLSQRSVVHCDLKPENILLVSDDTIEAIVNSGDNEKGQVGSRSQQCMQNIESDKSAHSSKSDQTSNAANTPCISEQRIKLIDFGSACFEGQTAHTYIQSRFYRSPEVLVGLDYDSAIDMWSLGCVAAELFLGLPILPGVHEHDQLCRIYEMIGELPDWMLEQGAKSSNYFVKYLRRSPVGHGDNIISRHVASATLYGDKPQLCGLASPPPPRAAWCLRTREEFARSLSEEERNRRGGLSKLETQPTNRYFKRKHLGDIVMLHGNCSTAEEKETLGLFIHFLKGILEPDPWKRWTAHQASMHPFITGNTLHLRRTIGDHSNDQIRKASDICWVPPWDPSICRRKLLGVQKARDRQQTALGGSRTAGTALSRSYLPENTESTDTLNGFATDNLASPGNAGVTAMTDAMSLSQPLHTQAATLPNTNGHFQSISRPSPPPTLNSFQVSAGRQTIGMLPFTYQSYLSGNLGASTGAPRQDSFQSMFGDSQYGLNASNFSQLHQVGTSAVDSSGIMVPPSTLQAGNVTYGDYTNGSTSFGPQSFSGIYYGRTDNGYMPAEGDLGYALQRPGVVPSMGNESVNTAMMQHSHSAQLSYLQHASPVRFQNLGLLGQSGSLPSGSNLNQTDVRTRDNGVPGHGSNSYSALMAAAVAQGLVLDSQLMSLQDRYIGSPTFMNINAGQWNDMQSSIAARNKPSLLAQQLAQCRSTHQMSSSDVNLAHAQNAHAMSYQYQNQGMMYAGQRPSSMGALQGSQYMSYVSADGRPLTMSALNTMFDPRLVGVQAGIGYQYLQPTSSVYDGMQMQVPQHLFSLPQAYSQHASFDGFDQQQFMSSGQPPSNREAPFQPDTQAYRGGSM